MEKKTILLLLNDTDPVLTRVMRNKYKHETGWDSVITDSVDKALELFAKNKPDIVITEIILKYSEGRSGFDFIEMMRNEEESIETSKPLIVVLTELSQEEDKQKAKSLGVDHYYVKSEISIFNFIEEIKSIYETA